MATTLTRHAMITVAVYFAGTSALSAATLATDGKPQMTIVLAEGAIPAERTAAKELASYLGKVAGGKFTVVGGAGAAHRSPLHPFSSLL